MKKAKKVISILVTLAMLIGLLLPMGAPALAASTYSVSYVPFLQNGANAPNNVITIKLDAGSLPTGSTTGSVYLDLPSDPTGYTWTLTPSTPSLVDGQTNALSSGNISLVKVGSTEQYRLSITGVTNPNTAGAITLTVNNISVPGGVTGDVKVTASAPANSPFSNGQFVIGTVGTGNVSISAESIANFGSGGGTLGVINVKESAPGALDEATSSVKFTLPNGFEWDNNAGSVSVIWGDFGATPTLTFDSNDKRVLKLNVANDTDNIAGFVKIVGLKVKVDESVAKTGEVVLTIGGDSTSTVDTVKVANYGDYEVTAAFLDTPTLIAGQTGQKIGKLEVKETIPGGFVNGRTLTLTLPDNMRWYKDGGTLASIDTDKSDTQNITISTAAVGSDGKMLKITFDTTAAASRTNPAKIVIKNLKITPAVDFKGDVKVALGGSQGVTGEFVAAKVEAGFAAEATQTDVQLGVAGQAAGDLLIKELAKGNFNTTITKNVVNSDGTVSDTTVSGKPEFLVELPYGVTFTSDPKVEVIAGDAVVDASSVKTSSTENKGKLTFTLKSGSTVASTIKVSGIKLTVDRTVPVGPITAKVKGTAVNQTTPDTNQTDVFGSSTTACKANIANVITPAQASSVTFNIGSSVYTVNGVATVMDAAPYIKNGRTFVPVRYLANAMGVSNENIKYENGKVTLVKGSTVVELTMGSNTISVNGVAQTMDVAPEAVNGRTMLPARYVAEAFGGLVGYANGQVVINLSAN